MRHWPLFLAILAVVGVATWYNFSPRYPIQQGLDLKGGMRVILEADLENAPRGTKYDAGTAASIRQILNDRVNAFGLSGATVASKGERQFVVEIPSRPPTLEGTVSDAKFTLRPGENVIGTGAEATIRLTDDKVPDRAATITFEGGHLRLKAEAEGVQYDGKPLPVGETRDLTNGDRLRFGETALTVRVPPGTTQTLQQLTRTAQLEFRWFRDVKSEKNPGARYEMNRVPHPEYDNREAYIFTDVTTGKEVPAKQVIEASELIVTGAELLPVSKQDFDPTSGIVVSFEFNRKGAAAFADFTRNHIGDILAVVLDGEVITAPRIESAILGGKGQIQGAFSTVVEARTLAQLLNAGALPVPLKPVQTQVVGATLGQDSVERSIQAGLWGLVLCLGFMAIYYLLPGILAAIALLFYATLSFAVYKVMNVVLDLPGITGFILSVGMAVDANILIFERLKEEMKSGKTLHAAVDTAFSRAFTSIFDSNVTTWIVCAVLYGLGPNLIKGFALTLAMGVAVSMFTAITITRTMLHIVVDFPWARHPAFFGLNRSLLSRRAGEGRLLPVFAQRKVFFTLSIALMVLSIAALGVGRLRPAIDFTGGSVMQVAFTQPPDVAAVRAAVAKAEVQDAQVQTATDARLGNIVLIRTPELPEARTEAVRASLAELGGSLLQTETIGPTIASEVTRSAFLSVLVSFLFIAGYLAVRFAIGGLGAGIKFGTCALVGLIHNIIAVTGLFALGGWLWGWQVDSLFITALLTVIGYTVNDTIVVYDRLRENLRHRRRGEDLVDIANRSITQSFDRSINTGLTVLLVLITLILFGGASIKLFNVALFAGVVVGVYSSVFVATPLVVLWERMAAAAAPGKRSGMAGDVTFAGASAGSAPSASRPVAAGVGAREGDRNPASPATSTNGGHAPSRAAGTAPSAPRPTGGTGSTIKSKRKRRM